MTVDALNWAKFTDSHDIPEWISRAYADSYQGPHDDGTEADSGPAPESLSAPAVTPALLSAHYRLGSHRPTGESRVAVYPHDDPGGFGPALQVVTDDGAMLMDSVTVLLHRLGVAYLAIMNPVFDVRRDGAGELLGVGPKDSGGDGIDETWIHVQLVPSVDRNALHEAERLLPGVLSDLRRVAADSTAMIAMLNELAHDVETNANGHYPGADNGDVATLLRWLAGGHFTLLGYQRCPVHDGRVSGEAATTSLGVLRRRKGSRPRLTEDHELLALAQTDVASYLRFGAYPYVFAVREDADGSVFEHRLIGLFTVAAMNADVLEIPIISRRVHEVLTLADLDPGHPGQLLLDVLQTVPRSELFVRSPEQLLAMAKSVVDLGSGRRALLFLRADRLEYFVSCLVYLPRDRYTTAVRLQIEDILVREFGGTSLEFTARVTESPWALLHFMVRLGPDTATKIDTSDANRIRLQALLTEAARTWSDRLTTEAAGDSVGPLEAEHYAAAFSEAYKQAVTPTDAINDIAIFEELTDDSVKLVLSDHNYDDTARLTWYLGGRTASLSQLLPMLQSMGVVVLEERPFTVTRPDGLPVWIYQFKITPQPTITLASEGPEREATAKRFAEAVTAIWEGRVEIDRFNELVMRADLTWQQVVLLRSYAKYLRQAGFPYSQSHIESVLNENPATARSLVRLFEALFDPTPSDSSKSRDAQAAAAAVAADIDALVSLDTDRVLRAFASLIQATIRTNYFVTREASARSQNVLSLKLDAQLVEELPLPRPKFEIFVYSPRVEGVHLRFGPVARGGLRWSDRREDFRTEILGLVKAQAVKNAVIVPVGAKGGFVLKRPPLPTGDVAGDRDALRTEGVACYQLFISGLLDVTDNVDHSTGKVSAPPEVIRRDGDDAYLVVAADKGTATFSDIANDVAKSYGFWLGDAFASGGSVGYDHKAMGITAKGAWEAVKRHFREMGVDTQTQDFTGVGVGDMSGDVFGNGMLLSKHIRLIAAFDHRHVFLDPNPNAEKSFAERERMFKLPRSSWADYDASLISKGGGIYPRSAKSIPVSPEIKAVLGIEGDATAFAPNDLMRAILKAPVDLLWNGGIGTYVKAEAETNADAGDRANNAIRINGRDLRCKMVGEGGNLGCTQRGRIEAAHHGVLLNTDFIDNSAGVDTSDHEVNIKILLNDAVQRSELTEAQRNSLLAAMTDEVQRLVLWDNYRQNQAITLMEQQSAKRIGSMAHFIRTLEGEGLLDRQVENLPSESELTERKTRGIGMTRPELSVLLSYDKIKLYQQLLDSDVPEDPYLSKELVRYFPEPLHAKYADHMQRHRLKREIIATAVTNSTINRMGATFMMRMQEDTGQGPAAIAKAYTAAREILDARELWAQVEALDGKVAENTQIDAILTIWSLLRHTTRWLLNRPGGTLDINANVDRYQNGVTELRAALPDALTETGKQDFATSQEKWEGLGMPGELALRMARLPELRAMLDIVEVATQGGQPIAKVAGVFYELGEALDLEWLRDQIEALPVEGHWHAQARGSLLDELTHQHRALALQVLALAGSSKDVSPVQAWLNRDDATLKYTRNMLAEILTQNADYPIASVAVRRLAQLAQVPLG